MAQNRHDPNQAIYIISVAAELAGMHPQTLRVYERKGLVQPSRTQGNTRRYSEKDVERLRKIQELTQEGVNLAGVLRIMDMENDIESLRDRYERALEDLHALQARFDEAFSGSRGAALVPVKDVRRIRRALKSDVIEEAGRPRVFTAGPAAKQMDTK